MMRSGRLLAIVLGLIAVAGIVLFSRQASSQANLFVAEANQAVAAANALNQTASAKYGELFDEENLEAFPNNRARLQPLAIEVADLFAKSVEQYRLASTKFSAAASEPADPIALEYWTIQSQSMARLADAKDAVSRMVLMLTDPVIDNVETLGTRMAPLARTAEALANESTALTARAAKILADNPGVFR